MQKVKILIVILIGSLSTYGIAQNVECELLTNTTKYWPAPDLNKPGYLQPITDPTFGTNITRIVGNPGEPIPNLQGEVWPSEQLRHGYSKRQPWNCDQSMIYLDRFTVGKSKLFFDGETYEVLFSRIKPASRVRWSHTKPNIMHYITDGSIGNWNVVENTTEIALSFSGYNDCTFGDGEGNFTNDDKKMAVLANRISDRHKVIFIADIETGTKGNDIDVSSAIKINNCTLSSLGNYLIAIGDYGNGSDRVRVYNASTGDILWTETEYGRPSHMDTQIDQNGDEVIVGIDKANKGKIIKRRLSDGKITTLAGGYASHASGRALKRKGWTFVTYQNNESISSSYTYFNELVAVKLDGSRNERICHIHSNRFTYVAEAHGVPSPDGLRVMFASDWDLGTYPVQSYVVDFRDKLIPTSIEDAATDLLAPGSSQLENYPNPFNSKTNISFSVQTNGHAVVKVFNLMGKEVATIFDDFAISKEQYSVLFDATSLPGGIYFAQLKCEKQYTTRKMIILK